MSTNQSHTGNVSSSSNAPSVCPHVALHPELDAALLDMKKRTDNLPGLAQYTEAVANKTVADAEHTNTRFNTVAHELTKLWDRFQTVEQTLQQSQATGTEILLQVTALSQSVTQDRTQQQETNATYTNRINHLDQQHTDSMLALTNLLTTLSHKIDVTYAHATGTPLPPPEQQHHPKVSLLQLLEPQQTTDSSTNRFQGVLPSFSGGTNVSQWLRDVDIKFAAHKVPHNERLPWVATVLEGHAADWWDSLTFEQAPTWTAFKELIKTRFTSWTHEFHQRKLLCQLHQVGEDIEGYIAEFSRQTREIKDLNEGEALYAF